MTFVLIYSNVFCISVIILVAGVLNWLDNVIFMSREVKVLYRYLGDTGIYLYSLLDIGSVIGVVLYNFLCFKHKKDLLSKASLCTIRYFSNSNYLKCFANHNFYICIEILIITVFQYALSGVLNRPLGDLVGTGANYFGRLLLSPMLVALLCYISGIDVFKQMDIITPAYPLGLIVAKLACFCAGCCSGITTPFGLYNHSTEQVEFPVQLVEMFLAAAIFVFLLFRKKKAKEGTMYPTYLIVYSATRFFSEFLRCEPNVLGPLKTYHLLCLGGIVLGVIQLIIVKYCKAQIRQIYDGYFGLIEKIVRNAVNKIRADKAKRNQVFRKKVTVSKKKMWAVVWLLGLLGQIGWNIEGTWFNVFVYDKIDKSPSIITPMLILSALATTVAIFLLGTLTDRTGNRRTLIIKGFIIWGVLTACFGFTQFLPGVSLSFAVVCIVLLDMMLSFFGSMGADVGYGTWLTDIMNDGNRGQIGGAIAIQCVLGSLLANLVGGALIGEEKNYLQLFIIIGIMLCLVGIVSIFIFNTNDDVKPYVKGSFSKQFSSMFDFKSLFRHKELVWVNVAVAVFFSGFNCYFPHLGNYIVHYLGFDAEKMGVIEAVPMVLAMLVTIPVSKLINKNKFTLVTLISVAFGLVGNWFFYNIIPTEVDTDSIFDLKLFIAIFFVAISYIIMLQATKVWTKCLYPKESRGQYEGLWAVSYAMIPMFFGSNIGERVIKIDGQTVLNELTGLFEYIPNGKVFWVGAVISTFSIVPIVIAKKYVDRKLSRTKNKK